MPIARRHSERAGTLVGAALLALLFACTDEKIIEVERPFFEEPPAAAGGVLGWDEADVNLTVCGNCHVGQQSDFALTAHAEAFSHVSGQADTCTDCHAVTERGNASEGQIGWAATHDPRYQDVQCESCHGPGATHVANPDVDGSHPLASLLVHPAEGAEGLTPAQDNEDGCGECHGGAHQRVVEEWASSPHAVALATPAGRAECQQCHRGQQILTAWGEQDNYKEKNSPEHLGIVCGVCHDPHGSGGQVSQLRFSARNPSLEENLCARCHNRRSLPDPSSTRGPHAPQAPLLIGDAGWFPPGANIDPGVILATHGTDRNPGFCATCHLPRFQITDPLRPGIVTESVSHTFGPIPCLGPNGEPLPFHGEDCELSLGARSFKACTGSGCHGTEQTALSALTAATSRIQFLAGELLQVLTVVDPNLGTAGGQISGGDPFTVADGAYFNYQLSIFGRHAGRGSTVHNPFLLESLLIASIQAVEEEYGVSASVAMNWDAELQRVIRNSRALR